jgi:hypothetical protein
MEQYIPTTGTASSILSGCANSGVILAPSSIHNMGKNMVGTPWYRLELKYILTFYRIGIKDMFIGMALSVT